MVDHILLVYYLHVFEILSNAFFKLSQLNYISWYVGGLYHSLEIITSKDYKISGHTNIFLFLLYLRAIS